MTMLDTFEQHNFRPPLADDLKSSLMMSLAVLASILSSLLVLCLFKFKSWRERLVRQFPQNRDARRGNDNPGFVGDRSNYEFSVNVMPSRDLQPAESRTETVVPMPGDENYYNAVCVGRQVGASAKNTDQAPDPVYQEIVVMGNVQDVGTGLRRADAESDPGYQACVVMGNEQDVRDVRGRVDVEAPNSHTVGAGADGGCMKIAKVPAEDSIISRSGPNEDTYELVTVCAQLTQTTSNANGVTTSSFETDMTGHANCDSTTSYVNVQRLKSPADDSDIDQEYDEMLVESGNCDLSNGVGNEGSFVGHGISDDGDNVVPQEGEDLEDPHAHVTDLEETSSASSIYECVDDLGLGDHRLQKTVVKSDLNIRKGNGDSFPNQENPNQHLQGDDLDDSDGSETDSNRTSSASSIYECVNELSLDHSLQKSKPDLWHRNSEVTDTNGNATTNPSHESPGNLLNGELRFETEGGHGHTEVASTNIRIDGLNDNDTQEYNSNTLTFENPDYQVVDDWLNEHKNQENMMSEMSEEIVASPPEREQDMGTSAGHLNCGIKISEGGDIKPALDDGLSAQATPPLPAKRSGTYRPIPAKRKVKPKNNSFEDKLEHESLSSNVDMYTDDTGGQVTLGSDGASSDLPALPPKTHPNISTIADTSSFTSHVTVQHDAHLFPEEGDLADVSHGNIATHDEESCDSSSDLPPLPPKLHSNVGNSVDTYTNFVPNVTDALVPQKLVTNYLLVDLAD